MATIGERLKELRLAKGLTLEAAGAIGGTTKQSMSQIEKGQTQVPGAMALEAWARHYRVNLRWLTTGEGPRDAQVIDVSHEPAWSDILGYAQAVGLGDGLEATEYAETHKLKFRADSLARKRLSPANLAVVYGKGDSMLPRILSGDAILFDMGDTKPQDERLYVVMAAGVAGSEYSVKRCRHFGEDVYFDALNPAGDHNWRKPRRMDDRRHPITIIGRVRWIGSWED